MLRREELGLTQMDVATRMTDLGFPFRQQTIQKIESGDRAVKVEEAHALAGILLSEVDILMMPPAPEYVEIGLKRIAQMKSEVLRALARYEAARMDAAGRIEATAEDGLGDEETVRKKRDLLGPSVVDILNRFEQLTPWFLVDSRSPKWYWENEFQSHEMEEFRFD